MVFPEIPELSDLPIVEAVAYLFSGMQEDTRNSLVSTLQRAGITNTTQLVSSWTTERIKELGISQDILEVFSENGLLPPYSYTAIFDAGEAILVQAWTRPSERLTEAFDHIQVPVGVEIGEAWCRVGTRQWEEEKLFRIFSGLLERVMAYTSSPYHLEFTRPQHNYPNCRFATASFYISNREMPVWKLVVSEDETDHSMVTSVGGLAYAVRELFEQQSARNVVVAAAFGWMNQLLLCKFVRDTLLPVECSALRGFANYEDFEPIAGLKMLMQLVAAPPQDFGFRMPSA